MALWKCAGATAGVAYACTDTVAPAVNADRHGPASPAHAERQAAPLGRKFRVNCERVALQVEAGKAQHHRLPERAQPGDAHPTGAVGVEVEVRGCGLAQIA